MVTSGEEIDARIATAVNNFRDRLDKLENSGLSDAKQIERIFLDSFHDGDARRAPELALLATEVAELIQKFNTRATNMTFTVGSLLFWKDMVAYAAILDVQRDAIGVGTSALKELPELFAYLDSARGAFSAGKDPGAPPNITVHQKIDELRAKIALTAPRVFEAGTQVAANIDIMASIIELRIGYLHEFRLSYLPLKPEEAIEKISNNFKQHPASSSRRLALSMIKGTVLAVAEHYSHLPLARDLYERQKIALVGEPLRLKPNSADALFIMRTELMAHAKALEELFSDCQRIKDELDTLASSLRDGGLKSSPAR